MTPQAQAAALKEKDLQRRDLMASTGKQVLPDRVVKALEAKGIDLDSVGGIKAPGGILETSNIAANSEQVAVSPFATASATPSLVAPPDQANKAPAQEKRRPNTLIYHMDTVGTDTVTEAENYLATIALHEVTSHIPHSVNPLESLGLRSLPLDGTGTPFVSPLYPSINPKTLPIPYRDLWEELEVLRKEREDSKLRAVWKGLDEILNEREKGNGNGVEGGEISLASSMLLNGKAAKMTISGEGQNGHGKNGSTARSEKQFDQKIQDQWQIRKSSAAYQKMLVSC